MMRWGSWRACLAVESKHLADGEEAELCHGGVGGQVDGLEVLQQFVLTDPLPDEGDERQHGREEDREGSGVRRGALGQLTRPLPLHR